MYLVIIIYELCNYLALTLGISFQHYVILLVYKTFEFDPRRFGIDVLYLLKKECSSRVLKILRLDGISSWLTETVRTDFDGQN